MTTFSIVIPIYNAEKFLRDCLESVRSQVGESTYEVIMVDDGAKDASGTICDEYAARYQNFKAFHTENHGSSSARNYGLQHVSGKYVLFLDADDLWIPETLNTIQSLLDDEPDMVLFDSVMFVGNKFYEQPSVLICPAGAAGESFLRKCFSIDRMPPAYAWTYAYKQSFLKENALTFVDGLTVCEDFEFNMRAIPLAKKMVGTTKVLYHYRQVQTSLSHTISAKKLLANLEVKARVYRRFPCSATARKYMESAVLLSQVPRRDTDECIAVLKENRDIIRACKKRSLRVAGKLFSLLGYYNGSWVFLNIRELKCRMNGEMI